VARKKIRLEVNTVKTKYMVMCQDQNDNCFERAEEF